MVMTSSQKTIAAFWLFILLALTPWAYFCLTTPANSDMLWLAEVLNRLLNDGSMARDAYENNPPLSLLTVAPPLFLSELGVPLDLAFLLFAFLCIGLSAAAIYRVVRNWPVIGASWGLCALISGFVFGETILTLVNYIGERDHLVALALFPFVLAQWSLTLRWPLPRVTSFFIFSVGALLILVKPHYGLLPVILLIHRAWRRRSLSVLADPDFLSLAIATIAVTGGTWLFFPDWVRLVMPDSLALYMPLRDPGVLKQTLMLAAAPVALILATLLPGARFRLPVIMLAAGALVNLIPFFIQGRGYIYHLCPSFGFFGAALGLSLWDRLERECHAPRLALFLSAALMAGMAYVACPLDRSTPSIATFKALPVTRMIATCDGQTRPCKFFMFNNNMGIIHEAAYYMDARSASRFPSFWFLPLLVNDNYRVLTAEQKKSHREKFSRMVGEDLGYYKPPLLLIGRFAVDGAPFNFENYFSADAVFSREWKKYRRTGNISVSKSDYFGQGLNPERDGPLIVTFDVYHRKP
jgi:hypothetical protein